VSLRILLSLVTIIPLSIYYFKDLNKNEHRTIVLITHDHEIAQHADRIVVLRDGEIIEDKKTKA